MGFLDFLVRVFGGDRGRPVEELAERLGQGVCELRDFRPRYREFTIPKRSGGRRKISAPEPETKGLQRRILRRVLAGLTSHPAAHGFEKGRSIVTNALPHVGKAVVVRMDLEDFFGSTREARVREYFRRIGWSGEAGEILTRVTTHGGALPQGAPTSPRLSNLVNGRLDARLAAAAKRFGAAYTRYADDITFSFAEDDREAVAAVIGTAGAAVADEGYRLHRRKNMHVRGRRSRQVVTGLVVNEGVNLPRGTRRWLRAVAHRMETGRGSTLTPEELAGWRALVSMIARQAERGWTG